MRGRVDQAGLATLWRWASMSGQMAGMQVLVQGLSAVTGLMLVRWLPKEEYGWFTLAGSLLASLSLLADGGLSTVFVSIGGRIHTQLAELSRLLRDCLRWQTKLYGIALLLSLPLFGYLLNRAGCDQNGVILLLLLAAVASLPSAHASLLNLALRVQGGIRTIQLSELAGATLRLVVTGVVLGIGWQSAVGALVATAFWAVVHRSVVKRLTAPLWSVVPASTSYYQEAGALMRSHYANAAFACVHGQVATWIIGFTAGALEVADLGALGRLTVLFTVISAPLHYLALPAFARITDLASLRHRLIVVWIGVLLAVLGLIALTCFWSQPLLWVLGSNYQHLEKELPLAMAAQGMTVLNVVTWGVLHLRRWAQPAWISIPLTLLGFVLGTWLCPLNTVAGLLMFSMMSIMPTLIVGVIWSVMHLNRRA